MVEERRSRAVPRSYLYVPSDRAELFSKAQSSGADALILDLEDAVAASAKPAARENLSQWLSRRHDTGQSTVVRVTSDSAATDIAALSAPVDAIMVPKAEPESVQHVAGLLSARESEIGVAPGTIAIIALIETAQGLSRASEIAAHDRVTRFAVGRADLTADLRLDIDPDGRELQFLVLPLVIASAANRIDAPIAPTSTRIREIDELRDSTIAFVKLGFRGRTAIHPSQIAIINDTLTPSRAEVDEARDLTAQYERAVNGGSGVFIDAQGRMVDAAVVRTAYETLSRAE